MGLDAKQTLFKTKNKTTPMDEPITMLRMNTGKGNSNLSSKSHLSLKTMRASEELSSSFRNQNTSTVNVF
jgi:hypothetical protein